MFREKKNQIFAGFDLGEGTSQISFCYTDKSEPETVSLVAGQELYSVPTVLCKRHEVNQWFFGRDAVRHGEDEDGILIEHLLSRACQGEQIELDGVQFDAVSLLALFVKRSLSLLTLATGVDKPDYLMITVDQLDQRRIEVLGQVGTILKMDREHLFFQGHIESFYQYTMHQPEELRIHDVVICDYTQKYMKTFRMECNRRTNPVAVFIDEKEYQQMINEPLPEEEPYRTRQAQQRDQSFERIVYEVCNDRIVTCVYLIGEAYTGDWCRESLRQLCRNRRVFQGNNLYSKGACYAIRERIIPGEISRKYIFLGQDMVKANIGAQVVTAGKEQYYPLLDAGTNWYDVRNEWEFLLESGHEFQLLITPLNGQGKKVMNVDLSGLEERPSKTTRLRLEICFVSAEELKLVVTDLGLGELYPASGMKWEQVEQLQG